MISSEFKQLLTKGIPKSIELGMSESFPQLSINIKDTGTPVINEQQEAIVLTISGHLFRLLIAVVFNKNEQLTNAVEQAQNKSPSELNDADFYDYLNELGNVVCGALKRELHKATPSLGMSTPNLLKLDSFKYIDTMRSDEKGRFTLFSDEQGLLHIDYYLAAYGNLEVEDNIFIEEEETDSGELEFF